MVIFWAIIVPLAIILRKSLSALFWEFISIAGEIAQRRIKQKNPLLYTKSKKRTYFIINLSTFQYEKSEPYDEIESQKLAPSMT